MMINMINQAADSWFSFMTHATWQATVTALLILAVVWRAQRLPANIRYLLLLVALAKFLAPPFLSSPIGVYSQVRLTDATIQPALHTIEISHGDELPSIAVVESKVGTLDAAAASTNELGTVREQRSKGRENSTESALAATPMSLERSPIAQQLSLQAWLMMLYALGAVLAVSWMANGAYHLRRIIRRCERVSDERQDEFLALARLMGIVRPVRLLVSCDPVMPMACGVFRPTVIISKSMMEQLSRPERRAILAHELAHHRRFDPAILWIQGAVLTMWWFHPLVWWLNRTLLREREQCCDDIVVVENVATREGYCAALVRAVTWYEVRTQFLGCAATRMGPLGNRIARAMDPHVCHSAAVTPLGWGFAILMCLVMLPGLAVHSSHALAVTSAPTAEEDQRNDDGGLESTSKSGDIGGRVVDERAQPVEATVWMGRKKSGNWVFKSTSTSPDGHFRFSNVEEGHVTLTAVSNGHSFSGTHFSVQQGQIERNLELVVTPTTTLAIRIRDEGRRADSWR